MTDHCTHCGRPTDTAETHHKSDAPYRPRTIYLGRDERGREYLCKTETAHDTVVVVDGGDRVLRTALDGLRVWHVIETVRDEIGWQTLQFGYLAHEKGMPRKYPGR